jgi:hypothetical protein
MSNTTDNNEGPNVFTCLPVVKKNALKQAKLACNAKHHVTHLVSFYQEKYLKNLADLNLPDVALSFGFGIIHTYI